MDKLTASGESVRDKHTHYEVYGHVTSESAIVVIRGDVFREFANLHGKPMTEYSGLEFNVDFRRSEGKLIGYVESVRDISILDKR